jgi:predicted ester cyclase
MTTATSSKPSFTPPTPSPEHLATQKVAQRLHELVSTGQNEQAIQELYADNARHVEAMEMPGCPRITEGRNNLVEKARQFAKATTVHSASCAAPIVNGDQFVCQMSLDCTNNDGPFAGHRMQMSEIALYTVKNGKITEGKFFYGGCGG